MFTKSRGCRRQRRPRSTGVILIAMLALTQSQTGCYVYVPAGSGIAPGTRMAYTLTDRGRVALSDQVGSGVYRLEGTVLEQNGSTFVLGMSRVRSIDGTSSRWAGERVTMDQEHVSTSFERRLSKQRTAMAIGAAVVGVTLFALTRNLSVFGIGTGDNEGREPPPNN